MVEPEGLLRESGGPLGKGFNLSRFSAKVPEDLEKVLREKSGKVSSRSEDAGSGFPRSLRLRVFISLPIRQKSSQNFSSYDVLGR